MVDLCIVCLISLVYTYHTFQPTAHCTEYASYIVDLRLRQSDSFTLLVVNIILAAQRHILAI